MEKDIYSKLGNVMKEVVAVAKSNENKQQNFKFRGIDDMMNALHNQFAKEGIVILPKELEHIQEHFQYNSKDGTKIQFRSRVHMSFTFVSCDDGSCVEADGWGEAADNGDKGYNKCKSIALKYVLMQMFLVPTQDMKDPDAETPDEVSGKMSETAKEEDDPFEDEYYIAKPEVESCTTVTLLGGIWNNYKALQKDKRFITLVSKRKEYLQSIGAE